MITFDWGLAGARALAPHATVVAVVDVLSFTTALTVAVSRGMTVRPYPWRDGSAAAFAREHDAHLAVGRREPGPVSLSPATIAAAEGISRLVLPSPNGSTVSTLLASYDARVVGVSLRNAAAAARWVTGRFGPSAPVAVIASGEHWPDGSLRPAVEDLWGAGAFISGLPGPRTPEACAAVAAYEQASFPSSLLECFGGRELIGYGFPQDVSVAAEVGVSEVVPVLRDGWYSGAHEGVVP